MSYQGVKGEHDHDGFKRTNSVDTSYILYILYYILYIIYYILYIIYYILYIIYYIYIF